MPQQEVASELAPTGVLRAAINMGNFLLVTGKSPSGDPEGVSPDMAREIATRLGVLVKYMPYARPRPGLLAVAQARPGSRILDGQFTAVQQAVGTPRKNTAGAAFLRDFVEEAKKSGLVARLIERHGVVGRLSVASPG